MGGSLNIDLHIMQYSYIIFCRDYENNDDDDDDDDDNIAFDNDNDDDDDDDDHGSITYCLI